MYPGEFSFVNGLSRRSLQLTYNVMGGRPHASEVLFRHIGERAPGIDMDRLDIEDEINRVGLAH